MANKGFDIAYDVMLKGAKLNIPPFASRNQQMSKKKVICTRKIASLRIHVERAIGRIKQYRILCTDVPLTLHNIIDDIWGICCALTLFHPPLVLDNAKSDSSLRILYCRHAKILDKAHFWPPTVQMT